MLTLIRAGIAQPDTTFTAIASDTITVPDGEIWEVLGVHALCTTSASVANRRWFVDYQYSGVSAKYSRWDYNHAASRTVHLDTIATSPGLTVVETATADHVTAPFMPVWIQGQGQIIINADGLQAGDTVFLAASYKAYRVISDVVQMQHVGPIAVQT